MQRELIAKLHRNFEDCAHEKDGVEFWYARELQALLGYDQWKNFEKVIEKAKIACEKAKQKPSDHFADVSKMVAMPKEAKKEDALHGEAPITQEHVKNNRNMRDMLGKSGIRPEELPQEEDIKRLERKLKSADKKLPASAKKL